MDSVYVRYINLDRRTDRDVDVKKKLTDILGFDLKQISRFSAIDGSNLVSDLNNKNLITDYFIGLISNKPANVKAPVLACTLSHYFLLTSIMEDNTIPDDAIIFVFEDDFFISDELLKKKSIADIVEEIKKFQTDNKINWDMIYLGGRFTKNFEPKNRSFFTHISTNLYLRVKGGGMDWDRTTHNYLVKKSNIPNIIKCYHEYYSQSSKSFEVDSFYNGLAEKLQMYDYFPHIFYSPWNYTTDIQNSRLMINTSTIK